MIARYISWFQVTALCDVKSRGAPYSIHYFSLCISEVRAGGGGGVMHVEDEVGHVEAFEEGCDTVVHDVLIDVPSYEEVVASSDPGGHFPLQILKECRSGISVVVVVL